jgi:signal transduction histidine kinase
LTKSLFLNSSVFDFEKILTQIFYHTGIRLKWISNFNLEIIDNLEHQNYFLFGLFYGLLLAIIIYNLIHYLKVGDKSYLNYLVYAFILGLNSVVVDGSLFYFFGITNLALANVFIFLGQFILIVGSLLFCWMFFENSKEKNLKKILLYLIAGRTILISFIWFLKYTSTFLIILDGLIITYIIYVGSVFYKQNQKQAKYFIAAFFILLVGYLFTYILFYQDSNSFIQRALIYQAAASSSLFLLSNALAYKVKVLKDKDLFTEKVNDELEKMVVERTREIENQKNIIELQNKELDNFVYRASHDLKGPLKSIIGLTEIAKKDVEEAKALEYFEYILKSTHRLESVLNDLIDISRAKVGTTQKEYVELSKVVDRVLSNLKYDINEYAIDIRLELEKDLHLYIDVKLFYSALQNLVENSIKYRNTQRESSFVKISGRKINKNILIEIEDNGIGIKPENQGKVFDMFYRAQEHVSGSGLGLYIVKMSIDKLGGMINLKSEYGVGTTFQIIF